MSAPRIAAPSAPPTMRDAWRTPEETPLLSPETAPSAVSIVVGSTSPRPSPERAIQATARPSPVATVVRAPNASPAARRANQCGDSPSADAGGEAVGGCSADEQAGDQGEQADAAALGVGAAHDLEVERRREQQPEHDEGNDRAERRSPREGARSEKLQVDERRRDPALPEDEHGERERAAKHLGERSHVAPAGVAGADDAVGEERKPAGRERDTDQIDPLTAAAAALREQDGDGDERQRDD